MIRRILLTGLVIVCILHISQARDQYTIYVTSISWHTGIIVPEYIFPDSIWPDNFEIIKNEYLEIGWGDRDYFQHPTFNLWYAFKAIFWPTSTALHVMPIRERHLARTYVGKDLVRLEITAAEFEELQKFLLKQFETNEKGKLIPLKDGFYYNSQFFAGATKYYFPKNSNVWAAMALKRAGFTYAPICFQTTGMVVNRADNFGEIVE